jgi:hypothetical protein
MTQNQGKIKFDGYKSHGQMKIDPFVDVGRKVHEGDTCEGYDDAGITTNDILRTKNVCRDLKKLESQFNVLCNTANEEIEKGNGDVGDGKYCWNMNQKYMVHQTNDCKQQMYELSKHDNDD